MFFVSVLLKWPSEPYKIIIFTKLEKIQKDTVYTKDTVQYCTELSRVTPCPRNHRVGLNTERFAAATGAFYVRVAKNQFSHLSWLFLIPEYEAFLQFI